MIGHSGKSRNTCALIWSLFNITRCPKHWAARLFLAASHGAAGLPAIVLAGATAEDSMKVSTAIELMNNRRTLHEGWQALEDLPAEAVVEGLATALASDTLLANEAARYDAYRLFDHHNATQYETGFVAVVKGLSERGVRHQATLILGRCAPERAQRAAKSLMDALMEAVSDTSLWVHVGDASRALMHLGASARSERTRLEEVLFSPSYSVYARGQCAGVLLSALGADTFWTLTKDRCDDSLIALATLRPLLASMGGAECPRL